MLSRGFNICCIAAMHGFWISAAQAVCAPCTVSGKEKCWQNESNRTARRVNSSGYRRPCQNFRNEECQIFLMMFDSSVLGRWQNRNRGELDRLPVEGALLESRRLGGRSP